MNRMTLLPLPGEVRLEHPSPGTLALALCYLAPSVGYFWVANPNTIKKCFVKEA